MLLLLPEDFVRAYEGLYTRVIGEVTGVDPDTQRASGYSETRVDSGQTQTMRSKGGAGGAGFGPRELVKDDAASAMKANVDRKLRKIARSLLRGEGNRPRRCTGVGCRKWSEPDWIWCPFCRAATEDLES